jgi:uncharacterized protein (TIGR00661 family)
VKKGKKRFLFIIQGEGRGHMIQAISLKEYLVQAGHHVCFAMVGKSERRKIPPFFYEKMGAQVGTYESPNFVPDKNNTKVKLFSTILYNLFRIKRYTNSLKIIDKAIKEHKPDVVVNFYELLCGLYYLFFNPRIPMVCLGNQYVFLHPEFPFPPGRYFERLTVKINTYLTCIRSKVIFALSFGKMKDIPDKKIKVMPPLLRKEIFEFIPDKKNHLLIYILFHGYHYEIIKWHKQNPETKIHCFWDKLNVQDDWEYDSNFVFHKIHDKKFLDYLRTCSGFISTAGFESICEAIYLGKPIFLVPTRGHFEQECNAADAVKAGAGIQGTNFDITAFLNYIPSHDNSKSIDFRTWANQACRMYLEEFEKL